MNSIEPVPILLRFLNKAAGTSGKPSLINIDKSGANTAAIKQWNRDERKRAKIRQYKYLNNIIEQDHRFIKRIVRPMLGFKSFRSAKATLAGIELWRMLKKRQIRSSLSAWEQFYALALVGWLRPMITACTNLRTLATEPQFAMLDAGSLAPAKKDTI